MNLKPLKTISIATYLVAGLLAVFFSSQSRTRVVGWSMAADILGMFVLPYGIFMFITWRLNNRFDLAIVSLVVSMLVLVYTVNSYVRALYVFKCHPGTCWEFAVTPFILTVVTPWVFLVAFSV